MCVLQELSPSLWLLFIFLLVILVRRSIPSSGFITLLVAVVESSYVCLNWTCLSWVVFLEKKNGYGDINLLSIVAIRWRGHVQLRLSGLYPGGWEYRGKSESKQSCSYIISPGNGSWFISHAIPTCPGSWDPSVFAYLFSKGKCPQPSSLHELFVWREWQ